MTGFAEPCLLFTRPDLASETIVNFDGKMANTVEYIIKRLSRHTNLISLQKKIYSSGSVSTLAKKQSPGKLPFLWYLSFIS